MEKLKALLKRILEGNQDAQNAIESKLTSDMYKELGLKSDENTDNKNEKVDISNVNELITKLTFLEQQNKSLFDEIAKLTANDKARSEEIQKRANDELKQKVKDTLTKYVKEGKIPAQNEELKNTYEKQLLANYDDTVKILEAIPSTVKDSKENNILPENVQSKSIKEQLFEKATAEASAKFSSINN
jgi:undecaprenyl pyrophosphate synthase